MSTQTIPRAEWTSFFEDFSRKHEGWGVTLEIFGPEIGDQLEERELFLAGVSADVKEDKIEIMIGGNPSRHLTHVIAAPIEVGITRANEGNDGALHIKSADGTTALLHLS